MEKSSSIASTVQKAFGLKHTKIKIALKNGIITLGTLAAQFASVKSLRVIDTGDSKGVIIV